MCAVCRKCALLRGPGNSDDFRARPLISFTHSAGFWLGANSSLCTKSCAAYAFRAHANKCRLGIVRRSLWDSMSEPFTQLGAIIFTPYTHLCIVKRPSNSDDFRVRLLISFCGDPSNRLVFFSHFNLLAISAFAVLVMQRPVLISGTASCQNCKSHLRASACAFAALVDGSAPGTFTAFFILPDDTTKTIPNTSSFEEIGQSCDITLP